MWSATKKQCCGNKSTQQSQLPKTWMWQEIIPNISTLFVSQHHIKPSRQEHFNLQARIVFIIWQISVRVPNGTYRPNFQVAQMFSVLGFKTLGQVYMIPILDGLASWTAPVLSGRAGRPGQTLWFFALLTAKLQSSKLLTFKLWYRGLGSTLA